MEQHSGSLKSVTVGVDSSDCAQSALQWGLAFGREAGTELRVLHAWPIPVSAAFAGASTSAVALDAVAAHAEGVVDKALAEAGATDIERIVEMGSPGPRLSAESTRDGLIVLGRTGHGKRHGLSRVAEIILGSAARYCLHHAVGPVATIPLGSVWPVEKPRVTVGLDGSAESLDALRWAAAAVPGDPAITAVHVFVPFSPDPSVALSEAARAAAVGRARDELAAWVTEACPDGHESITQEVVIGDARTRLGVLAESTDLVILGSRGRTGIARFVLGSVAEYVVRNAPCPVVVLPPAERAASPRHSSADQERS